MINTNLYTKASSEHEPSKEELMLPDPVDSQEAIFANTVGPSGDFTIFPYVSVLEYDFEVLGDHAESIWLKHNTCSKCGFHDADIEHECRNLAEKTDVLPAHP